MSRVKLDCGHEYHGELDLVAPRLPGFLARMVIVERPCRSCSRLRSTRHVRRKVYHRWDGNGDRLKDRTIRHNR